jgi:hypothetical protein
MDALMPYSYEADIEHLTIRLQSHIRRLRFQSINVLFVALRLPDKGPTWMSAQ